VARPSVLDLFDLRFDVGQVRFCLSTVADQVFVTPLVGDEFGRALCSLDDKTLECLAFALFKRLLR